MTSVGPSCSRIGAGSSEAAGLLAAFGASKRRESMVLGMRADGTMAHVREVASGADCLCICPACRTPLVARKGFSNAHHFGHLGRRDEAPCRTGPETALHLFAKEILAEHLEMRLPERVLTEDGDREPICAGGIYRFDDAILEQHLGDIVPDVVVRKGDRTLLVEFKVTHPCGPEKLGKIRERDLAVVEIDLGELPRDFDRQGIARSILRDAPRRWLHNPLDAAARERLASKRKDREVRRAADIRRRVELYRRHAESLVDRGEASPLVKRLRADGCSKAIGVTVAGSGCFAVPVEAWQSICVDMLIRDAFGGKSEGIPIVRFRDELSRRNLIRREYMFQRRVDAEAIRKECPDFASPYESIGEWALMLAGNQLFSMVGASTFRLGRSEIRRLTELRERRALPGKRRSELVELVARALDGLPPGELEGFEPERWLKSRLPGRSYSPDEAILADDERFASLSSTIRMLRHYLEYTPARTTDFFGLPLEAERERRLLLIQQRKEREEAQRRAASEQAAAAREAEIRHVAQEMLGSDAGAWLSAEQPDLRGDPVAAARSGQASLGKALDLARRARRDRDAAERVEREAEKEAEAARSELRRAVTKILRDPRHVDLFLECGHPSLGGQSPRNFCTNRVRLAHCISRTLPKKPRRAS